MNSRRFPWIVGLFAAWSISAQSIIGVDRAGVHASTAPTSGTLEAPAPAAQIVAVMRDGTEYRTEVEPQEDVAAVIVEFKADPLVVAQSRLHSSSPARSRAARGTLNELFARFDHDLERIERASHRITATSGRGPHHVPVVRYRYAAPIAGLSAQVSRDSLPAIAALDYAAAVHPDRRFKAMLESSVPYIKADRVWETFGNRGTGVSFAIIDTGIDYNHGA